MSDLQEFRREARAWLETNCPAEMRTPIRSDTDVCWGGKKFRFASDAQRKWLEAMAARGWTVPTWPTEYGGAGLTAAQAAVLSEEMARLGARPPLQSFGIWMLGPALLKYGNEQQKREHLPKIARGEIRWCQGYSEPEAGSDLASLRSRAEDHGDHFVVSGRKIWTSYADACDWIFCLVRTDVQAPKHQGISFVLIDMASAGVSTAPIRLISGYSAFCETLLEGVRVPKQNLVGEINKGWTIAKYLLTHEREMIGSLNDEDARPLGQMLAQGSPGKLVDPFLRARVALHDIDEAAFRHALERTLELGRAHQAHPAASSVLKYQGTELVKRRYELLMSALGMDALEWEGARSDDGATARAWLRTKAASIEGGTSEVQLNIIAKHVLGLPGT